MTLSASFVFSSHSSILEGLSSVEVGVGAGVESGVDLPLQWVSGLVFSVPFCFSLLHPAMKNKRATNIRAILSLCLHDSASLELLLS